MSHDVVLSSTLRLARNYPQYPFDTSVSEGIARSVEEFARKGLENSGLTDAYPFHSLRDKSSSVLRFLAEEGIITDDLARKSATAGYFRNEEKHLSILTNEEDHLRFVAQNSGLCLDSLQSGIQDAAQACATEMPYAYDDEWGYLTASPANVGTGFKATVTLHLPLITLRKQLGTAIQNVVRVGMAFRGVYGENNQALGFVYQVSNRTSLGKTQQELMEGVVGVAGELITLERELREQAAAEKDPALIDNIWRAYGVLKYARRVNLKEFMVHWSNLRLGTAMGILPLKLEQVDALLLNAQTGHIEQRMAGSDPAETADTVRAALIRRELD